MNYIEIISKVYPNLQVACFGDPTVYANIVAEGTDPIPSKADLDGAALSVDRSAVWEEIKIERDRRKAGGVKVGTHWFHSDDPSRIQQLALVLFGANMPPNLMWKTMTGEFVTMTQQLAGGIFQTSAGSDQTIFGKAEYHKQQMMASSDPKSYNYLVGWPLTYAESPEYVPN
jgi:hypothetical protein